MFLSLENNEVLTEKYIESVIYYLHPTYKMDKVTCKHHPYLFSRTAFHKFTIGIEVSFKEWTELEPVRLNWLLDFDEHDKSLQREFSPFNLFNSRHKSFQDKEAAELLQSTLLKLNDDCFENIGNYVDNFNLNEIVNISINTQWNKIEDDDNEEKKSKK